jgi:hypothetical protein
VNRFGIPLATGLLVGAAALHAGCSGNGVGSSILTNSEKNNPTVSFFIPDVSGRTEQVAFVSACALAYGFAHDPAKLRTAYLAYETKHGTTRAQLATIEKAYDSTFQAIGQLGHRQSSFCATKDGEEVKSELRRYMSGLFEPRSPPAAAASVQRPR